MATFINSSVEDVQFHLANQGFDGPIDLLVNMVKEAKIDVMEIFVSDITQQYVNYVKTLKELDYEYVAQYITLAATLIEIKSIKVLPLAEGSDDYTEELIIQEKQILSDVERGMLLQTPEKLKPLETLNLFYTEPIYAEDDYKLVIKNFNMDKLVGAFIIVLERYEFSVANTVTKTIKKERFSVADKVIELASLVRSEKTIRFYDLFMSDYTKLEIINVFLAILEIVKNQIAEGTQDSDGDIVLVHTKADMNKEIETGELLEDVK